MDTGAVPGTLVRFAGQQLCELPISKSVHLLGFSDLLNVLQLMDASPIEVVLLGVQPESTDWGTSLTPCVETAQGHLIDSALEQIKDWIEAAFPSTEFALSPAAHSRGVVSCVSRFPEK